MNEQMKDGEKLIVSFLVAFTAPWLVALVVHMFVREPVIFLGLGMLLSAYTITMGYQENEEFDRSIGTVFGQLTGWVIPTGKSWWIPKPFGSATAKTRVLGLELDRTRRGGNPILRVETSDGSQSEVSLRGVYDIVDLLTWVKVQESAKTLSTAISGFVRVFGLSFPASGVDNITDQKESLTKYLNGEKIPSPKGEIQSDVPGALMKSLGVQMKSILVDDINPPQSIIEASEAQEREKAEAMQEAADIAALVNQVQQLTALGISPESALVAAQAARGDIEGINVGGSGGDFTKGGVAGRGKSTPKKRR